MASKSISEFMQRAKQACFSGATVSPEGFDSHRRDARATKAPSWCSALQRSLFHRRLQIIRRVRRDLLQRLVPSSHQCRGGPSAERYLANIILLQKHFGLASSIFRRQKSHLKHSHRTGFVPKIAVELRHRNFQLDIWFELAIWFSHSPESAAVPQLFAQRLRQALLRRNQESRVWIPLIG